MNLFIYIIYLTIKVNAKTDTKIKNVKLFCLLSRKHKYTTEYTNFKDDLIEYKCSCHNKNYQQNFD